MRHFSELLKMYGFAPLPYGRRPCSERSERGPLFDANGIPLADRFSALVYGKPIYLTNPFKDGSSASLLYKKYISDLEKAAGSVRACEGVPAAISQSISDAFLGLSYAAAPPVLTGGSLLASAPPTINSNPLIFNDNELYRQLEKNKDILPPSFRGSYCDFDWYQGTIFPPEFDFELDSDGNPVPIPIHFYSDLFFEDLKLMFPDLSVYRESHNSPNHYKVAESFYDSQDPKKRTRFLMIEYLGHNPGIHCTTSGFYSAKVAQLLRRYEARPSRVDVAIDNYQPKSGEKYFNQMQKKILKFAKKNDLKINMQGDWYTGKLGRTLYIGSRDSTAQLCFYEKGLQIHGDSDYAPVYPHWCRMEFRFRPDSKTRSGLFANDPVKWLGSTRWVRELLTELGVSVEKTKSLRAPKAEADSERSRRYLVRQYGNTIEHWVNESGGFANFSKDLYQYIKKLNPDLKIEICEQSKEIEK